MQVDLVAPDRMVWTGEAEFVLARTVDGEIGILPRHTPVLGVLVPWPVRIRPVEGEEIVAAVAGGFLSVTEHKVSILGEDIVLAGEVDAAAARRELEEATGDDPAAVAARARATARLRAVGETV